MERNKPASVPSYISGFTGNTKKLLQQIRDTIRNTAPGAEETISYDIPCYKWMGRPLVYFAGYKNHVSVYPAPRGNASFTELSAYKGGKGTVQFPLDQALPIPLIKKIILHRMMENEMKVAVKKPAKKMQKAS